MRVRISATSCCVARRAPSWYTGSRMGHFASRTWKSRQSSPPEKASAGGSRRARPFDFAHRAVRLRRRRPDGNVEEWRRWRLLRREGRALSAFLGLLRISDDASTRRCRRHLSDCQRSRRHAARARLERDIRQVQRRLLAADDVRLRHLGDQVLTLAATDADDCVRELDLDVTCRAE